MFSWLNLLVAFLWFTSAIVDYADFCYVWQLKEYRLDRMRDFFSTPQGKNYWLKYPLLWRSLLAIVIFLWPINDNLSVKYILIGLFLTDGWYSFYKFKKHKLLRPKFTSKALTLILVSIFLEGIIFLLNRDWTILFILIVSRFFLFSGLVFFINRFTDLLKNFYIKKATKKLTSFPNLTVIGVTGSYGKTTVKNYLNHILSKKFKTITTPERVNTDIGVAKIILKENFSDVDIFIVEMGAYKIGEIKKIYDMVKPKIGILTAINEQHLSLFGDIEKTKQAKFELLNSLPENGLAIINSDNYHCRDKVSELKSEVWTFGTDSDCQPTLEIKEVKFDLNGLKCKFKKEAMEFELEAPLVGEFNAMNLAPCVLVALKFNFKIEEIKDYFKNLSGGLRIIKYGSCDIIDDSYNSNPDGFRSALDILSRFPSERRRIIITRGVLELGEKSDEIHEKISEDISFVTDELVVITKDFAEPLKKGLIEKYRTNFLLKENPYNLLDYIKKIKDTNSVILIENRVPEIISKELSL